MSTIKFGNQPLSFFKGVPNAKWDQKLFGYMEALHNNFLCLTLNGDNVTSSSKRYYENEAITLELNTFCFAGDWVLGTASAAFIETCYQFNNDEAKATWLENGALVAIHFGEHAQLKWLSEICTGKEYNQFIEGLLIDSAFKSTNVPESVDDYVAYLSGDLDEDEITEYEDRIKETGLIVTRYNEDYTKRLQRESTRIKAKFTLVWEVASTFKPLTGSTGSSGGSGGRGGSYFKPEDRLTFLKTALEPCGFKVGNLLEIVRSVNGESDKALTLILALNVSGAYSLNDGFLNTLLSKLPDYQVNDTTATDLIIGQIKDAVDVDVVDSLANDVTVDNNDVIAQANEIIAHLKSKSTGVVSKDFTVDLLPDDSKLAWCDALVKLNELGIDFSQQAIRSKVRKQLGTNELHVNKYTVEQLQSLLVLNSEDEVAF